MRTMTRRGFARSSLLASAGVALGPWLRADSGRTGPAGPDAGFALGLASYTFREFDLDSTLGLAARLGLQRISLKDVHLPLASSVEVVRATADRIKARGLVAYGCGVIYMTSEAEVDGAFDYARAGGMEIIIGVPDHGLLGRAERRVRVTGLRLAIHNHGPGDLRYPTPASILERIEGLDPRIGVCLDVGHCRRSGLDPSREAIRCGRRLIDVHLKDVTAPAAVGEAVEVGRGVVDVPRFVRTLVEMGFRGTAAFEYEKDGQDPFAGLAESVGYVRGVIAALGRSSLTKGGRS